MDEPKLRVLPRGTARVPDYLALCGTPGNPPMRPTNRFHGWTPNRTHGMPFEDPNVRRSPDKPPVFVGRHLIHVKKVGLEHAVEIPLDDPYAGEYRLHLRNGDLWPADEFTAQECGVKFDPTFGGEHTAEEAEAQAHELATLKAKHDAIAGVAPAPITTAASPAKDGK